MADDWKFEVPTTGTKHLPPDARYMEALSSQGYGFEVAIADLVDNSVDAGAKDVVIHFLRREDRLVSLLVVDDGEGMTDEGLDVAMTVGGRQTYGPRALGMFGTGLKSASLSHASSVTVVSKTQRTRAAGRRWQMTRALSDFQCDVVDPVYAQDLLDRYHECPIVWHGTVIRWDGVKDFPQNGAGGQTDRYLNRTISKLALHLGLHMHRFLARDDFNITIAVEDVRSGIQYMNFGVVALDPFAYPVTGDSGYPRTFVADVKSVGPVGFEAHIWPAKSTLDEYKAVGSVMDRQGLYFYRHNRLVQAGGWNNFRQPEQHLSLARVAVDIPDGSEKVFRMSVKKDGVEMSPEMVTSLENAVDTSGRFFPQYVLDADRAYRDSRKRSVLSRTAVIPPGKGIDVSVRETVEEELPFIPGEDAIAVRWQQLDHGQFFEIDRENRAIKLNQYYRAAILGGRRGSLNDAPLVKSMVYLMLNQVFKTEYSGSREKDNLQLWQAILVSAARAELNRGADHE